MNRILLAFSVASLFSALSIGCAEQVDEPVEDPAPAPAATNEPAPSASDEVTPQRKPVIGPACTENKNGTTTCCTNKSCVTF